MLAKFKQRMSTCFLYSVFLLPKRPVNTSVNYPSKSYACVSGSHLLLVELPLNLLVITGVVDDGLGQLGLNVSEP